MRLDYMIAIFLVVAYKKILVVSEIIDAITSRALVIHQNEPIPIFQFRWMGFDHIVPIQYIIGHKEPFLIRGVINPEMHSGVGHLFWKSAHIAILAVAKLPYSIKIDNIY